MTTDVIWAAGFFDGEGCIQLTTRQRGPYRSWQIHATAVNTDIRPLHKLHQLFGGSIHVMHRADNILGYLPSWQWITSHKKAEDALRLMLPYFSVKREQAELALLSRQYVKPKRTPLSHADQEALVEIRLELQRLKKNPPIPIGTTGLSNPPMVHTES